MLLLSKRIFVSLLLLSRDIAEKTNEGKCESGIKYPRYSSQKKKDLKKVCMKQVTMR